MEIARGGTVTPTKWVNVTHLKALLRADEVIDHLPTTDAFARKRKLGLNPDKKQFCSTATEKSIRRHKITMGKRKV